MSQNKEGQNDNKGNVECSSITYLSRREASDPPSAMTVNYRVELDDQHVGRTTRLPSRQYEAAAAPWFHDSGSRKITQWL